MPPIYPTLRAATPQADPGLAHTIAVANATDLQNIKFNLWGNHYLTGNIDASATAGWNGGLGFEPILDFQGTLDGCGYTVDHLTINRPLQDKVGLFSQILDPAKIANLTLSNVSIIGQSRTAALCGSGWTAFAKALIQNCHASGLVQLSGAAVYHLGGLLGQLYGTGVGKEIEVYDCTCSVVVDGVTLVTDPSWAHAGGFIAEGAEYMLIHNCSATGAVHGGPTGATVGGFAGRLFHHQTVTDCWATGDVDGESYVGGFAGQINANNNLARCSARGAVNPIGSAGSFSQNIEAGSAVDDCYAQGAVISIGSQVGGFAGSIDGNVTNCYSRGLVSGVGMILNDGGFNYSGLAPVVTDCYWDINASGALTSDEGVGHITGWFGKQGNYPPTWDFVTVWELIGPTARQIILGHKRGSKLHHAAHTTLRNVFG